jgi:Core-2/I-Branching enzyme
MGVAYLLLVHGAPEQAARLVARISDPEDTVIVHVDRRSELAPFQEAFARLPVPPVLTRRRAAVHWGGWGIVQATLIGMREALALARPWTHLVLLSGADYPIRSNAETRAFFAEHQGTSFLSWSPGEERQLTDAERQGNVVWSWSGDPVRLQTWWVSIRGRRWHFDVRRRLPHGLKTPYQGSAWWNLTPEAVRYCVRFLHRRPDARLYFRFVHMPDEFAFHMILLHSPLRDTLVNEDLRFMNWAGNNPPALTLADVPAMRASRKLFARKFDMSAHPEPLDALDAPAGG